MVNYGKVNNKKIICNKKSDKFFEAKFVRRIHLDAYSLQSLPKDINPAGKLSKFTRLLLFQSFIVTRKIFSLACNDRLVPTLLLLLYLISHRCMLKRIYEIDNLQQLRRYLSGFQKVEEGRECLYAEFLRFAHYRNVTEWNMAVRLCECLAIVGGEIAKCSKL